MNIPKRQGHCSISDTQIALSHMVNIYNDSPLDEDPETSLSMQALMITAIVRIQKLSPTLFTEDEINWVNTLADQLIEIEQCRDEEDDINNWKINDNFSNDSRNEDDYDKENNS